MRHLAIVLNVLLLLSSLSHAQSNPAMVRFLQDYVGAETENKNTEYAAALVDLRDNGTKEAIVYLWSNHWCGTGGCVMLILAPNAGSYKVITKTPIVRPPIRVLRTKTNGWHDLSVIVGGGGLAAYEAKLAFDGSSYPQNPSVPPAERLRGKTAARTVISPTGKGEHLFK
jgi:hypothetical protein